MRQHGLQLLVGEKISVVFVLELIGIVLLHSCLLTLVQLERLHEDLDLVNLLFEKSDLVVH